MASVRQISANRANAKNSTGPRSSAGKARSRLNAWKHGLTSEKIVVEEAELARFEATRAALSDQFCPEGGLESTLVERLASYSLRLDRMPVLEVDCLRGQLHLDFSNIQLLQPLSRYETALLNAFNRTLQQLLVLQDRRRAKEEEERTVEVLPGPDDRDAA